MSVMSCQDLGFTGICYAFTVFVPLVTFFSCLLLVLSALSHLFAVDVLLDMACEDQPQETQARHLVFALVAISRDLDAARFGRLSTVVVLCSVQTLAFSRVLLCWFSGCGRQCMMSFNPRRLLSV